MVNPGSWIQDPGSRILDPGSRILDAGSWVLDGVITMVGSTLQIDLEIDHLMMIDPFLRVDLYKFTGLHLEYVNTMHHPLVGISLQYFLLRQVS